MVGCVCRTGSVQDQRRQHKALEGLTGVVSKYDDTLVLKFGSGDSIEEAEKDHDI